MATRTALKEGANGAAGPHPAMATATKAPSNAITIPRRNLQIVRLKLIGDTSLITHAWSEKAKRMMLDKQMKKAVSKKEAKDPEADFESSIYRLPDGGCGVPAVAFKAAAVGACRQVDGLPMTLVKRALFVRAQEADLVRIIGDARMREDMVRLESGVADIRYRAEFWPWACEIDVEFNADVFSSEQVVNLVDLAGFGEGVCEWRPSAPKSATGDHGRWHVAREGE